MRIHTRHPTERAIPPKSNARIGWNPGGTLPTAIAQAKYANASATDPITAMMLRPASVFHQGAKIKYINTNSTVTIAAA